ncbi:Hypothetical protein, putative [Bodo saltans]|uniref:CKK domain-containing protein n=1 Tax=Bodo saltans TaxID=75058 RepID=A0A0S4JHF4_BODSA|nr:Hypothetical protein, putative [Bodo saltans]|eukprot:CUG90945.1 Hypothetical protein, putative [Bodo saltans]
MSIESYLMELVCSTRWICNHLLATGNSTGEPSWVQRYPGDAETAKQALFMLSKTHSHVEDMEEIPEAIVATLCEGALYLLASEVILGHCPPTMHQFLQQTTLQRQQSAAQAQLLLLRWLLTAEILQIDNVMGTIFEDAVTLEDYATDYDAHLAIARYFAQSEPFYLGAHVMILRGLMLHFINDSLQGEDVMNHLQLIAPDIVAGGGASSALMIEDALLLWIRGVLGLFTAELNSAAAKRIVQEICHVDDLYLHTNDGRVLALVIHHYQPALVDLNSVHFATPLSMWQRQDNWAHIIRAAEALGVWVGVFADEMVAHGFVTLQQHLLRIVQDLFLVLACDAEDQYETLRKTIEERGGNHHHNTSAVGSDNVSSLELEGHTTFVDKNVMHSMMITSSTPPPLLKSGASSVSKGRPPTSAAYETVRDTGDHPFDGQQHRETIHSRETIETNSSSPPFPISRDGGDDHQRGGGAAHHDDDGDDDDEPVDVGNQHGDFNFVMTGLFLQGVSIPIQRQKQSVEEEAQVLQPTSAATTQAALLPKSVEILAPPPSTSVLAASSTSVTALPAPSDEPHRSDSPVLVGRSAEFRRLKVREDNAVASSVAHFKDLRGPQRAATTAGGPQHQQPMRKSMVQGSVDVEGIESLLQELAAITNDSSVGKARPIGGGELSDPLAEAREQNHVLRWALEEQKRKVAAMVEKLRLGIRKQEFSAIVKHLKGQKASGAQSHAARLAPSVLRKMSLTGGVAATDVSFAQHDDGPEDAQRIARREDKFRQSMEHVRSSQQRSNIAERIVVSSSTTTAATTTTGKQQNQAEQHQVAPILPQLPASMIAKNARGGLALNFSTGGLAKNIARAALDSPSEQHRDEKSNDDASDGIAPVKLVPLESVRNARKLSTANTVAQQRKRSNSSAEPLADGQGGAEDALGSTNGTASTTTAAAPVVVKIKNNKSVMVLAFKHVLLTGQLNKAPLEKVLKLVSDLTEDGGHQFIVLFKDEFTQQFKGLYTVRPDAVLVRIYGSGPYMAYVGPQPNNENETTLWTQGLPYLFPKFFKFDSGSKTFQQFSAKWVNQAADGVAFAAAKPKMIDRERF